MGVMRIVYNIVFSLIFIFFSCSNGSEIIFNNDTVFVRDETLTKINSVDWISEIPAQRTQEFQSDVTINEPYGQKEGQFFSYTILGDEQIYPYLDGFGSLDTSFLSQELLGFLTEFIKLLGKGELSEALFVKDTGFLAYSLNYTIKEFLPLENYIIGKPFLFPLENIVIYEIPVRLIFKNGYSDAMFYFEKQETAYFCQQVMLGKYIEQ